MPKPIDKRLGRAYTTAEYSAMQSTLRNRNARRILMEQPLTPREAQRRTVRLVNYEDGLWDILLGLIFLALSLYPITRRLLGPELNLGLFLVVLALLVAGLP